MKRLELSRDIWLLLALFIMLAGFTAFVTIRQREIQEQQEIFIPYSSHSAQTDGTLALYEWLGRLGYAAERIENRQFQISENTRLLLILGPTETIESDEAEYIMQWVARGNILFVADWNGFDANGLFRELEAGFDTLPTRANGAVLTQPLMDSTNGEIALQPFNSLEFERTDFVTYAVAENQAILARISHGSGTVWISTAPDVFTNQNLRDEDNAKFAAALLAGVPRGSIVAFDEYHLGFKPEFSLTFIDVLYNSQWGWGVLFTIGLFFAYLAINGRRFGRVLPVPKTLARRSPSEYVTSMANLFRRANKRGMVLQHYRHSLKRRLGRPYHLNPEISDEQYVEMLTRLRPELDRQELVRILNALRRTDTTEADLVKTIEQSVTFGGRTAKP